GIGDGGPDYRNDVFEDWPVYINNTWIRNSHTLNSGFELIVDQVNVDEITQADGNYSFTAALTQGPNPLVASSTAGNGFATFMLGVGSGDLTLDSKNGTFTGEDYAGYLQDDWRVRPKFTLNLGLRYEVQAPRTERYNRLNYFDPTASSPLATAVAGAADCPACADLRGGLVFVGTSGVGRRQFPTEWGNVAPRFGFAYEVTQNTVARGGFGIFYVPAQAMGAIGTAGQYGYTSQTPYVGSPNGLTPSVYLSNPFPTGIIRPTGHTEGLDTLLGTGMNETFLQSEKVPVMENWNFDIQRQLPGSILVDAAYVGSRGLYLDESGEDQLNLDQLTPAALALGSALTQNVPNPFYGLINVAPYTRATIPQSYLEAPFPQWSTVDIDYPTGAQSIYNSFQLKVVRRFTSGLRLLAAYTGEKTIDDYSIIENEGQGGNAPQNYYDLAAERAVSSNDISQDLSVAAIYQLPFGRGRHFGNSWGRLTDAFLGGWQLNGILTEQTGFPLALSTETNTSDSGSLAQAPNYDASAPGCAHSAALSGSAVSRLKEWFNTACFTQPAPYTFGNVGRTMPDLRMDPYHDLDFSVFKNFRLGERFTLQFHAESFNLFNQVQFGYPNDSLGSPGFGSVTNQNNTPRELQFALKLLF
ncbi:MAG TPA: TonB-dependent receptor, partial [Terriglobia bacterium]|nr:TonB-dependent receptor [Terriglobia bacterium]